MKREEIDRFVTRIDDLASALEEYSMLSVAYNVTESGCRVIGMVPDILARQLHEVASEMHEVKKAK